MTTPEPRHGYTAAAIDAVTEAARTEHDFGGWLSLVLAYAAARLGSAGALTAGRPGSWEAADVDHLVRGLVPADADLRWYAEDDRKRRDLAAAVTGDDRTALAALCAAAAAQGCTWCRATSGPCVTGPDGYHVARFLGLPAGRAEARLAAVAGVPLWDMGGIVRMPVQAGEEGGDE